MPRQLVKRTLDYNLSMRIRGEIKAQGITVEKACEYAGIGSTTLYELYKKPTKYFPQTLKLMRNLTIPIDEVRAMICYPW